MIIWTRSNYIYFTIDNNQTIWIFREDMSSTFNEHSPIYNTGYLLANINLNEML